MDYAFELTAPANTTKETPVTKELKLTEGVIKQVIVFHPWGCAGLAHAIIREGLHQLYPSNPDGSYHSDGIPAEFPDNYYLHEPALLTLKAWNLDDTYPHTVYVRITIIREELSDWQQALKDLVVMMKALLGME